MAKSNKIKHRGFGLIEIVVAVAIIMLVAPAISSMALGGVKWMVSRERKLQAVGLAQEGLEAAKSIRDYNWNNVSSGSHGLRQTSGYWEFYGSSENLSPFTRVVQVTNLDSNRKNIVSRVTWAPSQSITLTSRFTKWQVLMSDWTQSTTSHFYSGTLSGTQVISQGDGAVKLQSSATTGTFISKVYDTGSADPRYQTLNWTFSNPTEGTIKFQTKTSNSQSGLGSAVWIGPDGTRDSYYTDSGTAIATQGGTRWFQFKVYFESTAAGLSPILESVTTNYAP